jgi:hypothetical protein
MKGLRNKLTYANVMATIAVFLAFGGGAYAAIHLPKNSVGTAQVRNGSITPLKLSEGAKNSLRGSTGPTGPRGSEGRQGPPGTRGYDGDPGERGPSDVYTFQGNPVTLLAGESRTVATLEPPPAEYLVTGEVNARSHGGELNCQIERSGIAESFPSTLKLAAEEVGMAVTSAPVGVENGDTIDLVCWAEEKPMTIKGIPRLTAVEVERVHRSWAPFPG